MRCVFCGATYPAGTYVCSFCKDYKGMEEISGEGPKTLAVALDSVFALMEEARQAFADDCEHPDLQHTDSSAHLAFCPDCDLEFECECDQPESRN